jgi:hypothetical protein
MVMQSSDGDEALRATVRAVLAYKFLESDGTSIFTSFRWPTPRGEQPGDWVEGAVRPCFSGIHACRARDVAYWMRDSLWEVELGGEIVASHHKVVAPRGRLLRCVDSYPTAARELCTVSALRTRDRAVAALNAEGMRGLADQFAAADTTDAIAALGPRIDETLPHQSHAATAAHMACDAAHFAPEGHPREHSPFIAANSAGFAADDFDAGFASERRFQSEWLADRLGLRTG